jgi:hypothetical protein
VSANTEINRARYLLDDFNRKNTDFTGISSLSEALGILSDLLSVADNDQDKKVVNNLVNTHKKNIIRRVSYALAKPEEFTFKQLDYFDKVIDEFIGNDFDDTQELVALQQDITKHKESARVDELSLKELARETMRDLLKSQSEEE